MAPTSSAKSPQTMLRGSHDIPVDSNTRKRLINIFAQKNKVTVTPTRILVKEAAPEFRVDHTCRVRPLATAHHSPDNSACKAPITMTPIAVCRPLTNKTHYRRDSKNKVDSSASPPPAKSDLLEKMPSARSPECAPVPQPTHTNVVHRYYSVPAPTLPGMPRTPVQHLRTHLLTRQYSGGHVWSTEDRRYSAVPSLKQRSNGALQSSPSPSEKEVSGDTSTSGDDSDSEFDFTSEEPSHEVLPGKAPKGCEGHEMPWKCRPVAAVQSRRKDWARGLYERFPPEEYSMRSASYERQTDDSLSICSTPSDSSSEKESSLADESTALPVISEGVEIPEEPCNITAQPNLSQGYKKVRPNTPMPVSRRQRKYSEHKMVAELDQKLKLAELQRKVSSLYT